MFVFMLLKYMLFTFKEIFNVYKTLKMFLMHIRKKIREYKKAIYFKHYNIILMFYVLCGKIMRIK